MKNASKGEPSSQQYSCFYGTSKVINISVLLCGRTRTAWVFEATTVFTMVASKMRTKNSLNYCTPSLAQA